MNIPFNSYPEQCVVYKKNNNKFNCKTTSLSTDTKDYISQSDLIPGTELVWKNKGKKYTVMFNMFKGIPM